MDIFGNNEIYNTNKFSRLTTSRELLWFTFMNQRDTGLPCEIFVDGGDMYEKRNHPLCLYVVDEDKRHLIPITISMNPKIIGHQNTPKLQLVIEFIKKKSASIDTVRQYGYIKSHFL